MQPDNIEGEKIFFLQIIKDYKFSKVSMFCNLLNKSFFMGKYSWTMIKIHDMKGKKKIAYEFIFEVSNSRQLLN